MLEVLIAGKLHRPAEAKTVGGKECVEAVVRVPTEGEAVFVKVTCWAPEPRRALLALSEGDAVCVAGAAKLRAWVGTRDAKMHAGMDVTATVVQSVYAARVKRDQT